jgi:deazaflavin-dependent oxidoreductase (nitroreductase family)
MSKTYRVGPTRRAVNVIVTQLVRTGIGPASTYLLTTTGCKTGRPRTTPVVVLVEDAEARWLVSPYGSVGWVHNVRAESQVSLQRGRRSQRLHAVELGAREAGPILKEYLTKARVTAPFFDAHPHDPAEAFTAEADRHPVFLLTADEPGLTRKS